MQTCSSPAPAFAAYTVVCTALSGNRRSGMVHHVVSDSTGPSSLRIRYRFLPAMPAAGRKR